MTKEKKSKKNDNDDLKIMLSVINEQQNTLMSAFDDMRNVLYDPDTGVFSRIRDTSDEHSASDEELKLQLVRLAEWKDQMTSQIENSANELQILTNQVTLHKQKIDAIERSKARFFSALKWIVVTVLAALIGAVITTSVTNLFEK